MNAAEAVEELKRLQPAALKAVLLDGTTTPIAVPKVRNRWSRVTQVLDSIPWVRLEALDQKGALLGAVEDDEQVEDVVGPDGDDRDVKIARVLLEVQRETLRGVTQMFATQMKGQAELVDALIGGVRSISESYQHSLQVQRAAQVAEAAGAGGGAHPEIMQMLMLAMQQPPKLTGKP